MIEARHRFCRPSQTLRAACDGAIWHHGAISGPSACRRPKSLLWRDQGSPVQQITAADVENVCKGHHCHEMLYNGVTCGPLRPQIAKLFSVHVARDRDGHVGRCWRAAHPLIPELLDDVIEKGLGVLRVKKCRDP
jgi:hypothetical protein